MPDRIDTGSLDIATRRRAELKALFPAAFTETRDEHGALRESVDFEKLKAELGTFSDVFENRRERYGMDWPGKKDCLKVIQQPSRATLKPCREESVKFDATENLFIEGDNLEVLKLLQKSYYGKVKMIYIDPPYNTGNEFIYPDNYSESLDTYLAYAGLIDSEGKRFATNTPNEGRFHTKWLNMMYPRLYLARNLLREDGAIFISIDENEFGNLVQLANEIFGEENLVECLVYDKKAAAKGVPPTNMIVGVHEYILCYQKSDEFRFVGQIRTKEGFSNPDNDPRGLWRNTNIKSTTKDVSEAFEIVNPLNGKRYIDVWAFSKIELDRLISENRLIFPEGDGQVRAKEFYEEFGSPYMPIKSNLGLYDAQSNTEMLTRLMGGKFFLNPKHINLLSSLITFTLRPDDIVLDFFAGSATTAHAVLDVNNQDKGNRNFICVQLPEPCDEDSEAFKAGFKTIADIGKERIRRVIKKLYEEDASKPVAERTGEQDRGFRVLKLDRSNFRQWPELSPDTPPSNIAEQLQLHVDHVSSEASPEDVLFEVLIKAGISPASKISKTEMAGLSAFSVEDGRILVCLADTVTTELIEAVSQAAPEQFLCLDRAFHGNDQLRANASQAFETRNDTRRDARPIAFRTI